MRYCFILSPRSQSCILIGCYEEDRVHGINDLLHNAEVDITSLVGISAVNTYSVSDKIYAEIVFNFEDVTEDKKLIDLAYIETCNQSELQILSQFLEYFNNGGAAFGIRNGIDVSSDSDSVVIQELPESKWVYNSAIEEPMKITETSTSELFTQAVENTETVSAAEELVSQAANEETAVFTATSSSDKEPQITIYYDAEQGDRYIYAIHDEASDSWISVRDILRLPATADYICSFAGNTAAMYGVFEMNGSAPVCHLLLSAQFTESPNVTIADKSSMNAPDELIERIRQDYAAMNEGIQVFTDCEKIVLPRVDCSSLSYVLLGGGDREAYDKYKQLYFTCNPKTSNRMQANPEDKVSISIPQYCDIKAAYSNIAEEDDGDSGNSSDVTDSIIQSYSDLNVDISANTFNIVRDYMGTIDFHDCLFYKEAAMVVKPNDYARYIALIEGQPENNDTPLEDIEVETYMALRNLVIYDLCTEKHIYTLAEVNRALSLGACGSLMTKFLSDMLEQAYTLNWSHTGDVFQTINTSDSGDDDDSANGSVGIYSCYYRIRELPLEGGGITFEKVPAINMTNNDGTADAAADAAATQDIMLRMQAHGSGLNLLKYQLNGKNVINSFGYIDAIIRLLRWGDRKPSSIYIPSYTIDKETVVENSDKKYVDLTQKIISGFSGVFKDTDREVFEDGSYYLVENPVVMDIVDGYASTVYAEDVAPSTQFLFGFALRSNYAKYNISQLDFVDIFTLATSIADGLLKVHGIDFDKATKEFSVVHTDKPEGYQPELAMNNPRVSITEAISMSQKQADSMRATLYPSMSLMKSYRLIGHLLPRLDSKAYPSIFKILSDSVYDVNQAIAEACSEAVVTDAANVQSVMRRYSLDSSAFVEYAFIQSTVNRFIEFNKLFEKTQRTLLDALNCALQVEMTVSSEVNSAKKTTVETYSIKDLIAKGLSLCYEVKHPVTRQPMCYVGLYKNGTHASLLAWRAGVYDVSSLVVTPYTYIEFLNYLKSIVVSNGNTLYSLINTGYIKNSSPEDKASAIAAYKHLQGSFLLESEPELLPNICREILIALKAVKK